MPDPTYGPKVYHKQGGDELVIAAGGLLTVEAGGQISGTGIAQTIRARFTTAQVNAGATILAAVAGLKYRLISAALIAVGGAVTGTTTVDILATQAAGSVKLMAAGQAALTQSALVKAGDAAGVVLADGASFAQNDVNTPITIGHTGAAVATATAIDVILTYALEP